MSSVIDTNNLIIKLIVDLIIKLMCFTALFAFLFPRACDVFCKCQVLETTNPKLTIKCFTKNHRLFMHDENYVYYR